MSQSEVKDAVSIVRNRRTDAMFVAAYLAVFLLVYLVVFQTNVGEFAQGVLTLVLGVFLNELKNMYSFETGTTRGEVAKSDTIKVLAEKQIDATEKRQVRQEAVIAAVATNGAATHPVVTPATANPETGVIPAAEVQPKEPKP